MCLPRWMVLSTTGCPGQHPIVIEGAWNLSVALLYPTAPEVLSGQRVKLGFTVYANADSLGDEVLVVNSHYIDDYVVWSLTDSKGTPLMSLA